MYSEGSRLSDSHKHLLSYIFICTGQIKEIIVKSRNSSPKISQNSSLNQEINYSLKEFLHEYEIRSKQSLQQSLQSPQENLKENLTQTLESLKVCVFLYNPSKFDKIITDSVIYEVYN